MTGWGDDTERLACVAGQDGAGGLERWITLPQVVVVLPHGEEPAVVCGAPVARAPLALFDDLFDRRQRRGEIGDRDELRPAQQLRGGLGPRGSHEHRPLSAAGRQAAQPIGDPPVQVPDRGELLAARQRLSRLHRLTGRPGQDKTGRVRQLDALRALQEQEMPQRLLAERQQVKLHPGREYPDRCGKLGRPNTGAAPIAVIRFDTSARCSISCIAISRSVLRHRPTASAWPAARPSPLPSLRLNSAYRYSHMIMCSS
jgi:hypothetical protein